MSHYLTTSECIAMTVQAMGTLRIDQLLKYFRNADDAHNLDFYIEMLIKEGVLDYNKSMNQVTYHDSVLVRENSVIRRILAFWIVAQMGYDNIRELHPLKYPSQILFTTETNETYDLTVCLNEEEAAAAERVRDLQTVAETKDSVVHIAVVRDRETGMKVLPYGFDSYCIYDGTTPKYFAE